MYVVNMLNLRRQASETFTDVSDASRKVMTSAEWATVAMISVTIVAVLALSVAVIALERSTNDR
jgi:hypothetical protein